MKEYLKAHNPKIALWLIGVLFISNLLTLFIRSFGQAVILYPSNLNEPLNWYRFVSYPLYVGGLLSWLYNSIVLYLTGLIIEIRLTKKPIIMIILSSVIIGGLVAILINQGDPINRPIASPTMITWGYWSAAIVTGVYHWKSLNLFEKILLGLSLLSIFSIQNQNFGFLIGQIVVIAIVAIISIFVIIKRKKGHNIR